MELFILIFLVSTVCLVLIVHKVIEKKGFQEDLDVNVECENHLVKSEEELLIVDVKFEGYPGRFEYTVSQLDIKSGNYVLVLTHDGIRCAQVVSHPRRVKVKDLKCPPFLLQSIVCTAEASDVAYYNECVKNINPSS